LDNGWQGSSRRDPGLVRREFLARTGLLGMGVALGGWATAAARTVNPVVDPIVGILRPLLEQLSRDTINGFSVFVLPGPDPYSVAQGVSSKDPGAMEAKTTDFLMQSLDDFVPVPDMLLTPVLSALATGLKDVRLPLPDSLLNIPIAQVRSLDDALLKLMASDNAIPASILVAMLMNFLATSVSPGSSHGAFASPFARLSYAEKAKAWQMLEGSDSDLVALLDANLPEPLLDSVSGLLKFIGGALLEFAAFGSYNEWASLDPRTRQLTGQPVGWTLSGYQPSGPVEGWDELKGYWQNRKQVRH
jgi:hypothetical protein